MRRVLVDPAGFVYVKYLESEPRMAYDDDGNRLEEQERDADGVPMWNLDCLVKPVNGKKDIITVKIALPKEPQIEEDAKVVFANLSAYAYASGKDGALSFSADKVARVREQR